MILDSPLPTENIHQADYTQWRLSGARACTFKYSAHNHRKAITENQPHIKEMWTCRQTSPQIKCMHSESPPHLWDFERNNSLINISRCFSLQALHSWPPLFNQVTRKFFPSLLKRKRKKEIQMHSQGCSNWVFSKTSEFMSHPKTTRQAENAARGHMPHKERALLFNWKLCAWLLFGN